MKAKTKTQLLNLNRKFYTDFAGDFSSTRQSYWPGWEVLSKILTKINFRFQSVLDVGCGNGRFLEFLLRKYDEFDYFGIDYSDSFIKQNRKKYQRKFVSFEVVDLSAVDVFKLRRKSFDLIVLIAILHHIPEAASRQKLLKYFSKKLNKNGVMVLTFWDFMGESALLRKIIPWQSINIDKNEVEQGDYLLSWGKNNAALRYCHYFSEEEKYSVINSTGLEVRETYTADGKSGRLNTYVILQK